MKYRLEIDCDHPIFKTGSLQDRIAGVLSEVSAEVGALAVAGPGVERDISAPNGLTVGWFKFVGDDD